MTHFHNKSSRKTVFHNFPMNPNQYLEPPHQDSLTPNSIQAVQETLHAAAPMPCGSSAHLIGLHASDHQGKEAHKQQ